TSFFVCNGINGDAPGQKVEVDIAIPGIGPARTNVNIGNGVIACAVAKLFVSGTNNEIKPPVSANQQLKCYSVTASPRNSGSPPPSYCVRDGLFTGIDTGVQDNGIQFICSPGKFLTE